MRDFLAMPQQLEALREKCDELSRRIAPAMQVSKDFQSLRFPFTSISTAQQRSRGREDIPIVINKPTRTLRHDTEVSRLPLHLASSRLTSGNSVIPSERMRAGII